MKSTVFLICLIFRLILTVQSHNSPPAEREIRRKISLQTPPLPPGDSSTLHLRPDGSSFKIALFADLHFGENSWTDWGPRQDVNSVKVMSTVLDEEHPGYDIIHNFFFSDRLVSGLNYTFRDDNTLD